MKRAITLLFFLFGTLCTIHSQGLKEPVRLTDMLKIRSIGNLSLNKTGSMAAFTVTCIEPDGDSKLDFKYVNHVYVVALDGSSAPQELTVKESSSQPAWSPDGERLAFVRAVDGKPQIFIISLHGGEPFQLTRSRYGASTPVWSPDGKKIVFSSSIPLNDLLKDSSLNPEYALPKWPFEQAGFERNASLLLPFAKPNPDGNLDEIRAYLDGNVTDKKAKVLTRLNFQDEQNVSAELSFNHYFIQSVQPGSQPRALTHGFYGFSHAIFTPDGRQLIFTAGIDSTEHPDRSENDQIYIADSNGNNLQLLLGEKKMNYHETSLSPSGNYLAFQFEPVLSVSNPRLAIINLKNRSQEPVIIPFDGNPANCAWSADEKYLFFTAPFHGANPLFRVDLTTKKIQQLSDDQAGIGSFDFKANHLVYVKTEMTDPFELFIADPVMQNSRPLSHFNEDWVKNRLIRIPEKHVFQNSQHMNIDYWVMKPTNYQAGKKYPLLLEIHGGPSAMWGPGETTMWHEFQWFCSRGYGVVYCNPRGSGGYGTEMLRANIEDWGAGPASDVLTALDSCLKEGWADSTRLLISGGSYGGYLVAWIVAHDHRFLAACSQRGVYDLATFFGEGNAWRLVQEYFGGYPWQPEQKKILDRESPISYVKDIHTPYIIFHGENDRRTGFVQGEMMYRSLKALNRPVEYVRHPGATHEITRSGDNRQRMDQMLRTYEFFERWLKKSAYSSKR